jgi:hypothetical protein
VDVPSQSPTMRNRCRSLPFKAHSLLRIRHKSDQKKVF